MFKRLLGIDKIEQRQKDLESNLAALEHEKDALAARNAELQLALDTKAKTPKEIATEKGEPWVAVTDTGFADLKNPSTGFFELDWNKAFITQLTETGYSGRTDEDVIDMWFKDICRGVYDLPPE